MSKKSKSNKQSEIRNVVVVSDLHCGCRLALCPDLPVQLDDGGTYSPSRSQKKIWSMWREFWDEWVPMMTKGEPYHLVVNGDAIEGVHHRATTQISQNVEDQAEIAYECLAPEVWKCLESGGKYFHIRGTEAHVGSSGVQEEQLARRLNATPNEDGQSARYDLWLNVAGGHLVHFLHHIGTTSSTAHETSALNSEIAAMLSEAARWGKQPPSVIVRSHRHRASEVRMPSERSLMTCFTTPAWQLKTPFAWRVAGARISTPTIGGSFIRVNENNIAYAATRTWEIDRSKTER